MNVIIFSKDRPAQLDLLLRSMSRFWPQSDDIDVKILWMATSVDYVAGYHKLYRDENRCWFMQGKFKPDLIAMIDPLDQHTMFLCDDDVFIGPYTTDLSPLDDPNVLTISLRLNPHLTHCQPSAGSSVAHSPHPGEIWWQASIGDYSYPMSLNGHIFRTSDILPILKSHDYQNPNELEVVMDRNTPNRPIIKCYDRTTVLNLPINQVQTAWENPHGNVSAEWLNEQFLGGKVIDLEPYVGYLNTACHEILPVKLITP